VSTVELLVPRCAGLDVAKDEVVACVRVPDGRGGRDQEVRTFPTFTSGLEALAGWLAAEGVTQVVLEATGQYWKPVWYVLEEAGFELLLVNARHVKILPAARPMSATRPGWWQSMPLASEMVNRSWPTRTDPWNRAWERLSSCISSGRSSLSARGAGRLVLLTAVMLVLPR
jgi:Transposase